MASTKEALFTEAKKWADAGYKEGPQQNETIFGKWYGWPAQSLGWPAALWCHMFISYCAAMSGNGDIIPRTASCLEGVAWFKKRGAFDRTPRAGDIVYFGPGGGTHVELVTAVNGGDLACIGGNTTNKFSANGDGVYYKTYRAWTTNSRIFGFGHPAYSGTPSPTPAPAPPAPPKQREDAMAYEHGSLNNGPNLVLPPPTNGGAVGWGGVYLVMGGVGGDTKAKVEAWLPDRKKTSGNGWATLGEYDLLGDGDKVAVGLPAGISKLLITRSGNTAAINNWVIEAKQA